MKLSHRVCGAFVCLLLFFGFIPFNAYSNPGVLDQVEELILPNGMKFILLRRPGAPVFSAYIRVKAGGVDEAPGKTGLAHLLEHMAFKGTSEIGTKDFAAEKQILAKIEEVQSQLQGKDGEANKNLRDQLQTLLKEAEQYVRKEEFSKIYSRNGASNFNATTSQDMTSYFVTMPATKFKLWAYLESSRLKDPVFREFYSERDVVMEERRTRVEDSPFGKLYETFVDATFQNSPYGRPTIGYAADIRNLSATDLQEFYKKYYVPGNLVGAIVGDIDLVEVKKILNEYFGPIPPGPLPVSPVSPRETQRREHRVVVQFDASPAVMIGYPKPAMPHPDDLAFDVMDQVLCEGNTSRLYKRLVEKERMVQSLGCDTSTPGSRLNNIFLIYASIVKGHTAEEVIKVVQEEIHAIEKEGITPEELAKAKKNIQAEWNYQMQANQDLAELLSYFEVLTGNWEYIREHPKLIEAVTSADLRRLAKQYLQIQNRTTASLHR